MKKQTWFKTFGWCHYPVSWQGWLFTILAISFMINTFIAIDRDSQSISDTLYGIFPYWAPTFLLLEWIASKTSRN